MTRTRPTPLVILGVVGAVAVFLLELAIVTAGGPRYEPPFTLPLALVAIGAVVVALAVPVWRGSRGRAERRVDPFAATRVALLAKASSLGGGLLVGAGIGLVGYLLTRSVVPGESIAMALAALTGAVVLLVAGLVAEHLCTVPPEDEDEDRRGRPEPVRH